MFQPPQIKVEPVSSPDEKENNNNNNESNLSPSFVSAKLGTSIMMTSTNNNTHENTNQIGIPSATTKDENNNKNNATGTTATGTNWNLIDAKVSSSIQTEQFDSMRKLKLLFGEVIDSIHHEIYDSEKLAREKLDHWEKTHRMNMWRWDATLDVVRDAEERARRSLVEAERMWREEFFHDVFALEMVDLDLGIGMMDDLNGSTSHSF